MSIFTKFLGLFFTLLASGGFAADAMAMCTAKSSSPGVDVGRVINKAGPDSDVPGYRQVGNVRVVLLSFICESDRSTFQMRFRETIGLGSNQLLRWDVAKAIGALRMRLTKATADGVQVDMSGEDQVAVPALNIVKDGMIVSLNLAPLHKPARTFTVEMQITGMIEKSFNPASATSFTVSPTVELINP